VSDVFTKAKRSEVMSKIRGRENKATEVALAKLFRQHGITGWRRQVLIRISPAIAAVAAPQRGEGVKIRPDFVFPKLRLAVFVDGCFWHGCPKHGTQPKANAAFWRNKISRNQTRDRLVTHTLRQSGWRVLRIWEHELARNNAPRLLHRIQWVV
jgi:DNA mismatch endonuclease (patch repair protein)